MALAKVILKASYEHSDGLEPPKRNAIFIENGKRYTVGRELDEIKRRNRKTTDKNLRKMRKFKNISNIDVVSLYDGISDFMREHGYSSAQTDDVSAVTQAIMYNREAAISMFYDQETLAFIWRQKQGKLK